MQFIFFVYTFFFINIYYYYSLKIYIKAYNTDMLHLSSGGKKGERGGRMVYDTVFFNSNQNPKRGYHLDHLH